MAFAQTSRRYLGGLAPSIYTLYHGCTTAYYRPEFICIHEYISLFLQSSPSRPCVPEGWRGGWGRMGERTKGGYFFLVYREEEELLSGQITRNTPFFTSIFFQGYRYSHHDNYTVYCLFTWNFFFPPLLRNTSFYGSKVYFWIFRCSFFFNNIGFVIWSGVVNDTSGRMRKFSFSNNSEHFFISISFQVHSNYFLIFFFISLFFTFFLQTNGDENY